jgi:hypothetical protein
MSQKVTEACNQLLYGVISVETTDDSTSKLGISWQKCTSAVRCYRQVWARINHDGR